MGGGRTKEGTPIYRRINGRYTRIVPYKTDSIFRKTFDSGNTEHSERFRQRINEAKSIHRYDTEFSIKIRDAKNATELQKILFEKHGYQNNKFAYLGFLAKNIEMVKRALVTIDELENKFPFTKGIIVDYGADNENLASFLLHTGRLSLGKEWNEEDDFRLYNGTSRFLIHPNATPESFIAHEFAHAIEAKIMHKKYPNAFQDGKLNPDNFRLYNKIAKEWQTGSHLVKVQEKALQKLGITVEEAYPLISGYAVKKGIADAFAEAFADVYANGDNASEVSKVFTEELLAAAMK